MCDIVLSYTLPGTQLIFLDLGQKRPGYICVPILKKNFEKMYEIWFRCNYKLGLACPRNVTCKRNGS